MIPFFFTQFFLLCLSAGQKSAGPVFKTESVFFVIQNKDKDFSLPESYKIRDSAWWILKLPGFMHLVGRDRKCCLAN